MIGLKGRNGEGKIFAEQVDDNVVGQALSLLNSDVTEGAKVRIMPDAHFGKGALVGTTIKLPENRRDWKVSPNVVGVDIGCGMMAYKLKEHDLNLEQVKLLESEIDQGLKMNELGMKIYDELIEKQALPDSKIIDQFIQNLKGMI